MKVSIRAARTDKSVGQIRRLDARLYTNQDAEEAEL